METKMPKTVMSKITGLGSHLPEKRLTNADFEKMVDTSDEWIRTRTGIMERRILNSGKACTDMGVDAAQKAMDMAGVAPEDIDLIIYATVTPDYRLPSAACITQKKMGLINAGSFDIVAACAGFLHGISVGDAYIKTGKFKNVLVIGAEALSTVTDYTDRNTCVLFGDGAGAVVLTATEDDDSGILSTFLKSDGNQAELLWIREGGSLEPVQFLKDHKKNVYIEMNGSEVFKHAVRQMADASKKSLKIAGLESSDVKWLIPHQANIRIMDATAKRLGIPRDHVYINIEKYGNTSAASVPIALDEAYREGKIEKGDIILMTAFGGGLTWASAVVKW
jgi:3-oxoacyl-[acyl-carrier-protein] synthase-3